MDHMSSLQGITETQSQLTFYMSDILALSLRYFVAQKCITGGFNSVLLATSIHSEIPLKQPEVST